MGGFTRNQHLGSSQAIAKPDDWSTLPLPPKAAVSPAAEETKAGAGKNKQPSKADSDPANAGIRRQPELPEHEDIEPAKPVPALEFTFGEDLDQEDEETIRLAELRRQMGNLVRQASLDPADDLGL